MGLFNVVDFDEACLNCGAVAEWQTKDCEPERYTTIGLDEPGLLTFYTFCSECEAWVEYKRKPYAFYHWHRTTIEDFFLFVSVPIDG